MRVLWSHFGTELTPIFHPVLSFVYPLASALSDYPESMAPSSALPIGASRTVTETQLVKLDPANSASDQASLLHSIIALVQTPSSGTAKADPNAGTGTGENGGQIYADDELIGSPVVGYLHM